MSDSTNRTSMNRRQALLLPATAGLGAALAKTAEASDSTKTAAHQAAGQLLDASFRGRENAIRQSARVCRWRRPHVQRNPVWPEYRRREPLASGQTAQAVGRRIPRPDLWRQLPAAPSRLHRDRAIVPAGLGRRLHERRHAQAERLDALR